MFMKKMFLLIILFVLATIIGCDKLSNEEKIECYLSKKYQQDFEVIKLEKTNIGQNFSKYVYLGLACPKGNSSSIFDVYLDNKNVKDNYQMILYQEEVLSDITDILTSDYFTVDLLDVEYPTTNEFFASYEDYKKGAGICTHFDVYADDIQNAVPYVYTALSDLKDAGFYFDMKLTVGKQSKYFLYTNNISMPTQTEMLEKFN